MSINRNNNIIHNLKAIAKMGRHMKPRTIVTAWDEAGLPPLELKLAEALCEPGALEAISAKPFTHARVEAHLEAQRILDEALGQMVHAPDGTQQQAPATGSTASKMRG